MNVLTTTWRQLVRRRLWPVALLLLAGLVAVPVLLAREPQPVPTPAVPGATSVETANVDDPLAEPVVAKAAAEDRSRRRRVLGSRKNPFEPAPVKKPKKTKKKQQQSSTAGDQKTTPVNTSTGSGGTTAPSGGAPTTPVVTVPKPPKKTYAKDSLIVRFGDATSDSLERLNLKKLEALPKDDVNAEPLLVYMGLTDHGKKAVFLVDASLDATGDGACKPHPSNCETIELAKGETEFFDVIDDETGDVTAQYQLDLVDIK